MTGSNCERHRKHEQRHPRAVRVARTSAVPQTQEPAGEERERNGGGYKWERLEIPGCPAHLPDQRFAPAGMSRRRTFRAEGQAMNGMSSGAIVTKGRIMSRSSCSRM